MERAVIFAKLKEILGKLRQEAYLDTVDENTTLVRDLGLDSLTVLLMALAAEKEFGIRFEGTPQFDTVGQVVEYIEKAL